MNLTPVYKVMTDAVYEVAPDTSLETAARMLTSKGVSGAPVVAASGR